LQILEQMVR